MKHLASNYPFGVCPSSFGDKTRGSEQVIKIFSLWQQHPFAISVFNPYIEPTFDFKPLNPRSPMLSKTIQDAFNGQIAKEFYSAYLYLSMSGYFQFQNLPGCAHWMRVQYQEEMNHALKLFDYVNERHGRVVL